MSQQRVDEAVERSIETEAAVIDLATNAIMSRVEVKFTREGGYKECLVPVDLIDNEEVPVKPEHALAIAANMKRKAEESGGTGQDLPTLLALIEGEPDLKIADGYHRDAALRINGETVESGVIKRYTWDQLFDDRIVTAKDHRQVRFSRVVHWMQEAWTRCSGLSDRLTIEQALVIYKFNQTGNKLGISQEEAEAAKAWVANKESKWGVSAITMYSYLHIAEHVDPSLVHSTREKKRSDVLDAPTQEIVKIFAKHLKDNFVMQNLVMEAAMENNLPGPKIKSLCIGVSPFGEDAAAARLFMRSVDWDNLTATYGDTKRRALRRTYDARYNGDRIMTASAADIKNINDRIDLTYERDEEITDEMVPAIIEAREKALELARQYGELAVRLSEMAGEEMSKLALVPATEPRELIVVEQPVARPKAANEVELPSEIEDLVDESDQDLDEEAVLASVVDEEISLDDALETPVTTTLWDDELEDEPEEEDAEDDEPIVRTTSVNAGLKTGQGYNESASARSYKEALTGYLTGKNKKLPEVSTRSDIRLAEAVLSSNVAAIDPDLVEDLREEVREAYRKQGR